MLLERNISNEAKEFISTLLEYRGKAKLSSTYIKSYYTALSTQRTSHIDILHPSYWMVKSDFGGTVTGRLASSHPNFQNQPPIMRRVYTSRFDGGELTAIDLNQAELRMLAVESKDPLLLEIYHKDEDLHGAVASEVVSPRLDTSLGLNEKQVRRIAKTLNFGIAYMVSASGLQRKLKAEGVTLSFQDAEALINSWYTRFRGVAQWQAKIKNQVLTHNEVYSIFGRRRRLPGGSLMSATGREVLRQAVNFPIQSGAADLMTYGIMPAVMLSLISHKCKSLVIMNRHDEIVIDVHPQEKEVVDSIIQDTFVNPPLPAGGVGLEYFSWDTYCASIKAPIPMKYEVKSFAASVVAEEPDAVAEEDEGEEDE
jgi:DNA polymerase-1